MTALPTTQADWTAATIEPEGRALIDGRLVDAISAKTFAKRSPVDGRKRADVSSARIAFGGFKPSGFGRDHSPHAFDKDMDFKTIWTAFG